MDKRYITGPGAIGAVLLDAGDGTTLLMYSAIDGKIFERREADGVTVIDSWKAPIGTLTANSNLIVRSDGTLLMAVKKNSENPRITELGGADFALLESDDGGRTWAKERIITDPKGCYYLMNGRMLRLSSGRMLVPLCYHPDELLYRGLETAGWSGCLYSDDEGDTWRNGQWLRGETVDGHLAEPMVVELSDGSLAMCMRTGFGYLYGSRSDDGGVTWSEERSTTLKSPCAPFCVMRDPFSGFVFAVWDNSFPAPKYHYPRTPLSLAVSRDDCDSWEFVMDIEDDPMSNFGYPNMFFTEDTIVIIYYAHEGDRNFSSRTQRLKQTVVARSELTVRSYTTEKLFTSAE